MERPAVRKKIQDRGLTLVRKHITWKTIFLLALAFTHSCNEIVPISRHENHLSFLMVEFVLVFIDLDNFNIPYL